MRDMFEELSKFVEERTGGVGAVANLNGVIATTDLTTTPRVPQAWAAAVVTLPTSSSSDLAAVLSAYTYLRPGYTALTADAAGLVQFPAVVEIPSAQTAAVFLGAARVVGAATLELRVRSEAATLGVVVDGVQVGIGADTLQVSVPLSEGTHRIAVYAVGLSKPVTLEAGDGIEIRVEDPEPPAPAWQTDAEPFLLDPAKGTVVARLQWSNSPEAAGWHLYRSDTTQLATITSASAAADADGYTLVRLVVPGLLDALSVAPGMVLHTEFFELGGVAAVTPNTPSGSTTIDVLPPYAADTDYANWAGLRVLRENAPRSVATVANAGEDLVTYDDTTVSPDALYLYRLTAVGPLLQVESRFSAPRRCWTNDDQPPDALSAPTITVTGRTAVINFTTPVDLDYAGVHVYGPYALVSGVPSAPSAFLPAKLLSTKLGRPGQQDQVSVVLPEGQGACALFVAAFDQRGNEQGAQASTIRRTGTPRPLAVGAVFGGVEAPAAAGTTNATVLAQIVANPGGYPTATYVTVLVSAEPTDATITLDAVFNTTGVSTGTHQWTFTRPAYQAGMARATFKAVKAGYLDAEDTVVISEVGRDTIPLLVKLKMQTLTATTATVRLLAASKNYTYANITIDGATATQVGGTGAGTNRVHVNNNNTITYEGEDYYVDFTIPRPALNTTGITHAVFTVVPDDATVGMDIAAIAIPVQEYVPGPGTAPNATVLAEIVANPAGAYSDPALYTTVGVSAVPTDGTITLSSSYNLGAPVATGTGTWTFARPAFRTGTGKATFKVVKTGYVEDYDSVTIPEVGQDTIPLATKLRMTSIGATTVTVRAMAASKNYSYASIIIEGVTATQVGGTGVGSNRVHVNNLNTLSYEGSADYYVDYTIPRPAQGTLGITHAVFTFIPDDATISTDSDSIAIPVQEYVTPPRSLPIKVHIAVGTTTATTVEITVSASAADTQSNAGIAITGGTVTQLGGGTANRLRISTTPGLNTGSNGLPFGVTYQIARQAFGSSAVRLNVKVLSDDPLFAADVAGYDVPAQDYSPAAPTPGGSFAFGVSLDATKVGAASVIHGSLASPQVINASWPVLAIVGGDSDIAISALSPSGTGTAFTFTLTINKSTSGIFNRVLSVTMTSAASGGYAAAGTAAFTIDAQAPNAVQNLSAASGIDAVLLSWDTPAPGTGETVADVDHYDVFRGTNSTLWGQTVDTFFMDVANVYSGTSYTYWVQAVDAVGNRSSLQTVSGAARQIVTADIQALAIKLAQMDADSVGPSQIVAGAVTSTKLGVVNAAYDPGKITVSGGTVTWAGLVVVANGFRFPASGTYNGSGTGYYVWFDRSADRVVATGTSTGPFAAPSGDANPAFNAKDGDVLLGFNAGTYFAPHWGGTVITGDLIQTGTVEASHITTNTLAAIKADLGQVTAGIVQNAASNPSAAIRFNRTNYALASSLTSYIDLDPATANDYVLYFSSATGMLTLTKGGTLYLSGSAALGNLSVPLAGTMTVDGTALLRGTVQMSDVGTSVGSGKRIELTHGDIAVRQTTSGAEATKVLMGTFTRPKGGTLTAKTDTSWDTASSSIPSSPPGNTTSTEIGLNTISVPADLPAYDNYYRIGGSFDLTVTGTSTADAHAYLQAHCYTSVNGGSTWDDRGLIAQFSLSATSVFALNDTATFLATVSIPSVTTTNGLRVRLIAELLLIETSRAGGTVTGASRAYGTLTGTTVQWSQQSSGTALARRGLFLGAEAGKPHLTFEPLSAALTATDVVPGELWYDATSNTFKFYDGTAIRTLSFT